MHFFLLLGVPLKTLDGIGSIMEANVTIATFCEWAAVKDLKGPETMNKCGAAFTSYQATHPCECTLLISWHGRINGLLST